MLKGVLLVGTWHDTYIMWQQGVWLYWADLIFFMSIIMFLLHGLYDYNVRRQQELFFLWLLLGEYGLIFSHTLHDVSGVDGGAIMVQRGYSLDLEDQEVLPHTKKSPIYINIPAFDFGIGHVKEESYEMTRALSQSQHRCHLGVGIY